MTGRVTPVYSDLRVIGMGQPCLVDSTVIIQLALNTQVV